MAKSLTLMNRVVVSYMSQSSKEKITAVSRYISLEKMLRVTAICLRFVITAKESQRIGMGT